MSSEESLNSDNDYKNNNKNKPKQRKPDMQVYVPRAKRIEDQVKQRMSSDSVPGGQTDHPQHHHPSGGDGGGARKQVRSASSPSPDNNRRETKQAATALFQSEFPPTWDEHDSPSDSKIRTIRQFAQRLNSSSNDAGGDMSAKIESTISAAKSRATTKKGQPPANKHPSQLIQEMLKKHNIAVPSPDVVDKVVSVETTEETAIDVRVESTEEESLLVDLSTDKSDEPLIKFNEPPLLSPPIVQPSEGDSSILSCLPDSYQDFVMKDMALNAAAASQRLAAVQPQPPTQPASLNDGHHRQSFSSIVSSPTTSEAPVDLSQAVPSCSDIGGGGVGRSSPGFDADDLEVKMINESFEEAQRQMQVLGSDAVKKAWNMMCAQQPPLNPVVTMPPPVSSVGSSLSSKSRKESFGDATSAACIPAPSTSSTGTSSKSRTSSEGGGHGDSAVSFSSISKTTTKPVAAITRSTGAGVGDNAKLTWAGWGGDSKTVDSSSTARPSQSESQSNVIDTLDSLFSTTTITTAACMPSTSSSGALVDGLTTDLSSMPSISSVPFSPFVSSISHSPVCSPQGSCSAIADIKASSSPVFDVNDTIDTMDMLSAAMIEKVLSDDMDDDFASCKISVPSGERSRSDASATTTTATATMAKSSKTSSNTLADIWNRDENVNTSTTGAIGGGGDGVGAAAAADSWEDLFDQPGEKLIAQLMQQVKVASPAKAKAKERKEIDYFTLESKEVDLDESELSHVAEAYGFSPSMKGDDLYLALRQLHFREFKVEWVDDTHALVVFKNAMAAQEACDSSHPMVKLRPMSKASSAAKAKAKKSKESLLPFMKRPDTSALVARRLVESHLGKRSEVGAEQRKRERDRLQEAKEQKKVVAQQRADIWEGRL